MCSNIFLNTIEGIRDEFVEIYENGLFIADKTGKKTVEILAAQFLADETEIFGELNKEYLETEIEWYLSQDRNINSMKPPIPALWKSTAGKNGETNSNYGWCVYSQENFNQFGAVILELQLNKDSRRAIAIYTRPSMQIEFCENGKNDFMCTNSVQYFIRGNQLHAYVNMRSNDAIFGYKCDYHWQKYVLEDLHKSLVGVYPNLTIGNIIWNVGSLHIYERHFYLIERFIDTGNYTGSM